MGVRVPLPEAVTTLVRPAEGLPVATINADSPEHLFEEIRRQEQEAVRPVWPLTSASNCSMSASDHARALCPSSASALLPPQPDVSRGVL